jgi:glutathione synthase/RimK-type ligase-like ATP-grasp enzyme
MILVWGSRTDTPTERVVDVLEARAADVFYVDENDLASLRYDIVFDRGCNGWIELRGRRVPIEDFRGVYIRPGKPVSGEANKASMVLLALVSQLQAVVINPPAAGNSNMSKPYQLGLIAQAGFKVPDTLVTTDPAAARAFLSEHGRLIYKSVSGIRSIVATLEAEDQARLEDVRTGPVQLQQYVAGLDVRVHIVGTKWFACSARSSAADYRHADTAAELAEFDLPEILGKQLVALVQGMNLLVAGVDLRLTPDGSLVCFEVNPSPGFTYYEDATGHQIGESIVDLLLS